MVFRLLSDDAKARTLAEAELRVLAVPVAKRPPAPSTELHSAFRLLSDAAGAEDQRAPVQPEKAADQHALLVEASKLDVASTVRSIEGVRR